MGKTEPRRCTMRKRTIRTATAFVILALMFTWGSTGMTAGPSSDLPQPSSEFGTPEGTAKIAAKAGFLNVVGIKLGTPVKDAVEALKAYNASFKVKSVTLLEYEAL